MAATRANRLAISLRPAHFTEWQSWATFSAYQQNHTNERISAAEYYANATEHGPSACRAIVGETGLIDWLTCLVDNVGTDGSAKQAEYDLKAQQDMAAWAFGMLIATVWLTVITLFGVFFVWRTLVATQKMALDTRGIGEAQVSAYLSVKSIKSQNEPPEILHPLGEGGILQQESFVVEILNSGASPALRVVIKVRASFGEAQPERLSRSAGTIQTGITPIDISFFREADDLAPLQLERRVLQFEIHYKNVFGTGGLRVSEFWTSEADSPEWKRQHMLDEQTSYYQ